jgi:branched-chain amino acid transport system ATP-binding protein
MSALLEVEGLEVFYGASQALFGVDLRVGEGQAVALMGRNGMGKTTTIHSICRMLPVRAGASASTGATSPPCPRTARRGWGIGLVPEGRRCFPNLTVTENLIAAARPGAWTLERVRTSSRGWASGPDQYAATLSGGEQQMLAIGRALMTNPRLLVLDEATEGLAPVIRQEIWAAIAALKAEGLSILLVDKTLSEILPLADACVILERGRSVWQDVPAASEPRDRETLSRDCWAQGPAEADEDINRRLEHAGYENIEIERDNGFFTGTARRYGEDIDLRVQARTGRVVEPARLTPGQVQYRLEYDGYTEIGDVEERDGEFRVTAQRFGEEQELRVSPRTGQVIDPRELTADQLTGMLEDHEYQNVMLFEREDEFGHQMAVGELEGERFLLEIHPTRGEIVRERAMMN